MDDGVYMPTTGLYVYDFWYLDHICDFEWYFADIDEWNTFCLYDAEFDYGAYDLDPCLLYYDNEDYDVCARCEMGAVRIFT